MLLADALAPTVIAMVGAVAVAVVTGFFGWLTARAAARRDPEEVGKILEALAELSDYERRRDAGNGSAGSHPAPGGPPPAAA